MPKKSTAPKTIATDDTDHAPSHYSIHWFRRDLRLGGNEAVLETARANGGRVLGFFCIDPAILSRPDFSARRFAFFLKTLRVLQDEFAAAGSRLLVFNGGPDVAFARLFGALEKSDVGLPSELTFSRDYEPFARARDARIEELAFSRFHVNVRTFRDHLTVEPTELVKNGGGVYQVYGPFKKKWFQLFETEEFELRRKNTRARLDGKPPKLTLPLSPALVRDLERDDPLDAIEAELARTLQPGTIEKLPPAGAAAARKQILKFEQRALADYSEGRDIPGIAGTSQISIYLKNGSITVPEIIELLDLAKTAKPETAALKYFQELVWREFYYHILYHFPYVATEAFNPKYRALEWENREDYFRAWCEGRTGFPIVDAGMRQMNETGWMHNRVRMIVASFLTKDLLVDYRWGERYFMDQLLDGDLAPNNGGWQWGASTGCDPQPYFRIFNPISQGKRFDPDGEYIRRWVPELARLDLRDLHAPQPHAIVDHAVMRARALALFKSARATKGD